MELNTENVLKFSLIGATSLFIGSFLTNGFDQMKKFVGEQKTKFVQSIMKEQIRLRQQRRPHRLILVRHGQSAGNIDRKLYFTQPDSQIPLTDKGRQQAKDIGKKLKQLIGDEHVTFYVSPYERTKSTFCQISSNFDFNQKIVYEQPRIREQEWGHFQKWNQDKALSDQVWDERTSIGRFYYRFEDGESGADVYNRVSQFWESVYRQMDMMHFDDRDDQIQRNIVIVTHGLTLRVILMRYFQTSVQQYDNSLNPENGETWILKLNQHHQYQFDRKLLPEVE